MKSIAVNLTINRPKILVKDLKPTQLFKYKGVNYLFMKTYDGVVNIDTGEVYTRANSQENEYVTPYNQVGELKITRDEKFAEP